MRASEPYLAVKPATSGIGVGVAVGVAVGVWVGVRVGVFVAAGLGVLVAAGGPPDLQQPVTFTSETN